MAYGQTGSGKTHTMMGGLPNDDGADSRGMIPRAIEVYCKSIYECVRIFSNKTIPFLLGYLVKNFQSHLILAL